MSHNIASCVVAAFAIALAGGRDVTEPRGIPLNLPEFSVVTGIAVRDLGTDINNLGIVVGSSYTDARRDTRLRLRNGAGRRQGVTRGAGPPKTSSSDEEGRDG